MKISHVVSAVNENKMYEKHVEHFILSWTLLFPNITPVILYTGPNLSSVINNIPSKYIKYIHHFYIEGINTCFVAQIIRIFYPALINSDNFVLISDIDMIPLNKKYFELNHLNIQSNHFVCYRSDCIKEQNMYPICYNAAVPKKWSEIFQIFSKQNIIDQIKFINNKINYKERDNFYWYTDQYHLFYIISERKDVLFLTDSQTGYYRLGHFDYNLKNLKQRISNNIYNDFHMSKDCDDNFNKKIINFLVQKCLLNIY